MLKITRLFQSNAKCTCCSNHKLTFIFIALPMPYIEHTKNWISKVVIGYNFCPFAARAFNHDRVHYAVITSTAVTDILAQLLAACKQLDEQENIETTLLILPEGFADFYEYLDLVDAANTVLEEADYEGVYQLASFHPNYLFEGSNEMDAANYTNRSPYPMLHLLRESSIEGALAHYAGDPEAIPERNIEFAQEKGLLHMQALRLACMK